MRCAGTEDGKFGREIENEAHVKNKKQATNSEATNSSKDREAAAMERPMKNWRGPEDGSYDYEPEELLESEKKEPPRPPTREEMRKAFCKYGMGVVDEMDTLRWRPQRQVIRDILLSAAECGAWLTLKEIHDMTHFPEASIGAHVRGLRKGACGAFLIATRKRIDGKFFGVQPQGAEKNIWEYRVESRMVADERVEYKREEDSSYRSWHHATDRIECEGEVSRPTRRGRRFTGR
jgi:hypothetical protein